MSLIRQILLAILVMVIGALAVPFAAMRPPSLPLRPLVPLALRALW
jgi:hypothetical protein